ncbi:hypothetical protein JCM14469_20140 [Desulfatiferula olefinivorans]
MIFRMMENRWNIRAFLGKAGLLPPSMRRSGIERRTRGERRGRQQHEYLISQGANRRFAPDRRRQIDRRAGDVTFDLPGDDE